MIGSGEVRKCGAEVGQKDFDKAVVLPAMSETLVTAEELAVVFNNVEKCADE